jgi:hypothetical protein
VLPGQVARPIGDVKGQAPDARRLEVGDRVELRGPIGGYFVWEPSRGGPLGLIGGGSGIAPLMAMLRARVAADSDVAVRMLCSWRSASDVIYNELPSVTGIEVAKRDMSASHTRPWSHTKLGGARPHVHSCLLSPQCWPPWRSRLWLYISWRGRSLVRVGHG